MQTEYAHRQHQLASAEEVFKDLVNRWGDYIDAQQLGAQAQRIWTTLSAHDPDEIWSYDTIASLAGTQGYLAIKAAQPIAIEIVAKS